MDWRGVVVSIPLFVVKMQQKLTWKIITRKVKQLSRLTRWGVFSGYEKNMITHYGMEGIMKSIPRGLSRLRNLKFFRLLLY